MKYGYIPPESSGSAAYRTEEFYKDAVKNFQMMANLPVTGEFIDMNSYVIGWKKVFKKVRLIFPVTDSI